MKTKKRQLFMLFLLAMVILLYLYMHSPSNVCFRPRVSEHDLLIASSCILVDSLIVDIKKYHLQFNAYPLKWDDLLRIDDSSYRRYKLDYDFSDIKYKNNGFIDVDGNRWTVVFWDRKNLPMFYCVGNFTQSAGIIKTSDLGDVFDSKNMTSGDADGNDSPGE